MQQLIHRHDPEVESLVIASLLTDPEGFNTVDGQWPDEAFYVERNRKIYRAAWQVWRDTGCADITLIRSRLRDADQAPVALQLIGILNEAWESISFAAWLLPAYARRLRSLYADRERGKATLRYQQAIAEGQDEAEARIILDATLDALESLTPSNATDEEIVAGIGEAARYPTGYSRIDTLSGGLTKPGLNILAARPSVGKSALMRGIIRHAAKRGDTVFWYSLDQGMPQIMELEIAHLLRKDTKWTRDASKADLLEAVKRVRTEVWRDRVILIDTPLPLPTLLSHARMSSANLVCIDYLQVVDTGNSGESEYQSVTTVSKALKALSLEMGVPVLGLAQYSRDLGDNEPPTLRHLKNSGQIEQDADQVWGLQRDTSLDSTHPQQATLHVLKNKTGGTGKVALTWVGQFAAYEAYADGARYAS